MLKSKYDMPAQLEKKQDPRIQDTEPFLAKISKRKTFAFLFFVFDKSSVSKVKYSVLM